MHMIREWENPPPKRGGKVAFRPVWDQFLRYVDARDGQEGRDDCGGRDGLLRSLSESEGDLLIATERIRGRFEDESLSELHGVGFRRARPSSL